MNRFAQVNGACRDDKKLAEADKGSEGIARSPCSHPQPGLPASNDQQRQTLLT